MEESQSITILNTLIQINNDRIKGYQRASRETELDDLKTIFARFISRSERCINELSSEVEKWGGIASECTNTVGKFFRIWMEVKFALIGNDRLSIIDACEYGEGAAVHTYERVLKNNSEFLSLDQEKLLISQYKKLKRDHETIKCMRRALQPIG